MSFKWYYLLPFPLLPALCVYTARALRLAQGEKGEEIVLGLLVSLLLDLLYGGVLLWLTRCDQ